MKEWILEFQLSLHGITENTRDNYLARMEWFGSFLTEHGIMQFEKVEKKDIDIFLSKCTSPSTKNLFIARAPTIFDTIIEKNIIVKNILGELWLAVESAC